MNIGEAAQASGVTAKMIRHYESIGIIPKPTRTGSGYRVYDGTAVNTLRFIRKARSLGFGMKEIKKLVGLWRNRSRASADVKSLVQAHIRELEAKIEELSSIKSALQHLAQNCHGDLRPECPILNELGDELERASAQKTRASSCR